MENVRQYRYIKLVTQKRKELFIVRTKLSWHKDFPRKFVGNENEQNPNIYEETSLIRSINIRIK